MSSTNNNDLLGFIGQLSKATTGLDDSLRELSRHQLASGISGEIHEIIEDHLTTSGALFNSLKTLNSSMVQVDANHQFAGLIGRDTVNAINRQNNMFNQEIANKRRMTEINNYYSNMNTQINFIMRNLVIILAIVIIITVLAKKGIIPKDISNFATVFAILVIIIYILYNVYDLNIRDRFNFVQYKIPFSQEARKQGLSGTRLIRKQGLSGTRLNSLTDNIRDRLTSSLSNTCIGEDCCAEGTIYDINRNTCILEWPSGTEYMTRIDQNGQTIAKCG